jgi:serine/threonine protein phosphatase PrpC
MKLRYASLLLQGGQDDFLIVDERPWSDETGYLFVVVDGSCAEAPCDPISSLVAKTVYSHFYDDNSADRVSVLQAALRVANSHLRNHAGSSRAGCAAVLFHQQLVCIVNVGPTRVYTLTQYGEFDRMGWNQLNGCLGASVNPGIETWVHTLDHQSILLFSDGITRCATEGEIEAALRGGRIPEEVLLNLLATIVKNDCQADATAIAILAGTRHETSAGDPGEALAQPVPMPRGPQGELYAHAEAEV